MARARDLARQASEALDEGRPDAAQVLADLAHIHFRIGLRAGPTTAGPGAAPPAGLPLPRSAQDWDDPGLPADCAPGRLPGLLTVAQVHARIDYGLAQGWTQRRIGTFAGCSATVVNRKRARKKK
ncbi:hypothetical protein [Streptomyces halstedii]|uniref:Uncharacterized protein n=1 Tax=Streptomyces halstedii TaxID=1944 RepID=A0A6N9TVL5_STRHA|nr:hypothetical protein [Streptomyces halstedii]NEA15550.1 hypothetical protein [Streptomyces halstedii]